MENNKLKLTTMSVIIETSISIKSIDLLILGLFLNINDKLLGIYLDYMRGVYILKKGKNISEKKGFYNQLSMIIKLDRGIEIKCKLFINGNIHVCGCKSENDVKEVFETITNLIYNFNYKTSLKLYPLGSLIVDSNNFIYNVSKKTIIGLINENKIYIEGENVQPIENTQLWISKKFNHVYQKKIYNSIGDIVFSFYKKDVKGKKENNYILEKIKNIQYLKIEDIENFEEVIELSYKNNIYDKKFNKINIILYNCVYDSGKIIKKQELFEKLKDKYFCTFNPDIYHGVKLIYFFNERNKENTGICNCENVKICDCEKGTLVFCTNGKVLLYGFKNNKIQHKLIEFIDTIL
jgi:hypothetical protein